MRQASNLAEEGTFTMHSFSFNFVKRLKCLRFQVFVCVLDESNSLAKFIRYRALFQC